MQEVSKKQGQKRMMLFTSAISFLIFMMMYGSIISNFYNFMVENFEFMQFSTEKKQLVAKIGFAAVCLIPAILLIIVLQRKLMQRAILVFLQIAILSLILYGNNN